MLLQGIAPWSAGAVHDTVTALLRDRAYYRSFWSSLLGRLLVEAGRFITWLVEAVRNIPGGRNTVIGVVAAISVVIIVRILMSGRWSEDGPMRRRRGPGRVMRIDPWTEAESLAAAGDFMGAAHALYQAVLRRLATSERLRLHPSKTTGDYVRELRRRGSPLVGPFQVFGRRFDRVVFGAGECSAEEFATMLREATAMPDRQTAA